MVMLQNSCAKVKPSSAFVTLILSKEELIYMMFPAFREKQLVMLKNGCTNVESVLHSLH